MKDSTKLMLCETSCYMSVKSASKMILQDLFLKVFSDESRALGNIHFTTKGRLFFMHTLTVREDTTPMHSITDAVSDNKMFCKNNTNMYCIAFDIPESVSINKLKT